ncbi:MAG: pentapeptide repeat-containing protein [Nitrospira sp.]|nr:pentapeptide repeat-containing protein [Nitrospira sp.]
MTLLAFIVYAAITVWSTTDEQLLRGSAVKLPLLDVAVSIVGFYTIAPGLLLILHANLLLYVMLLASRLQALEETLVAALHPAERHGELLRLEAFSITQWLSGDDEGIVTRTTAQIVSFVSIYVIPVGMLLWFQIRFLPAHRPSITSGQRWIICFDLVFLWLFWWQVRRRRKASKLQLVARVIMGIVTICVAFFSIEIAVAPRIPSWWVEANKTLSPWFGNWPDRAVRSLPRALKVTRTTLVAEAPSQEVLAAYYQRGESIDSAWIQEAQGLNFTWRDLRYTDFERSRLWNADFRDSRLDGVNFHGAELRGVLFTTREGMRGGGISHGPAILPEAELSEVNFSDGELLEAILDFADLTQGTFPGSDMRGAKLRGTTGRSPDLRGAALARIKAGGAYIPGADLRGADLRGANLQCADLSSVQLQGSDLRGAMLQGAIFQGAQMQGADLRGAKVFATDFNKADLTLSDLRGVTFSDPSRDEDPIVRPYTGGGIIRSQQFMERVKSCPKSQDKTLLLDNAQHSDSLFDREGPFKSWGDSVPPWKYEEKVVSLLVPLGCDDRYIARGLLWEQQDTLYLLAGEPFARTQIFGSLGVDPILLRRASALIKGLEASKCQVLENLPTTNLQKLKTFLREREHLTP